MLIGEYIHTLDDKNRLSLPAKFRKELGKEVVVAPGLENCLFLFSKKEWQKISSKLAENSMLQRDIRGFNRFFFGQASEVPVDAIGRILLPDFLKVKAGLQGKVVVIGVENRVEFWNEKAWADYKKIVEKSADTLAEKLGELGVL
ncbi:MAG: division/cell wall cluster transcriptional repressor MraZ [Candidatus Pacebacteria bacterium]|jgi:MraZ protein|nr:division/cell wall cluster transcriptional repressor MraZ [Candidatus Paceibacterota bacterium]